MYQGSLLTVLSCIGAQGFRWFLKITWEPFEAQFQPIETRFRHHTDIVVRSAGAEFHTKEALDKQRQAGECYSYSY